MDAKKQFAMELASEIDNVEGLPEGTTWTQLVATIEGFIDRYYPNIDFQRPKGLSE